MEIKILGTGCPRCKRLEELTREALAETGIEAVITKVTDVNAIVSYQIMSTPGLVINEEVKSAGRLPRKDEIIAWLKESRLMRRDQGVFASLIPTDDGQGGTLMSEDEEEVVEALSGCCCHIDPFAALPPEERPRGKPPMGDLRHVICPVCGLEYWTNRVSDVCPKCAKEGKT